MYNTRMYTGSCSLAELCRRRRLTRLHSSAAAAADDDDNHLTVDLRTLITAHVYKYIYIYVLNTLRRLVYNIIMYVI